MTAHAIKSRGASGAKKTAKSPFMSAPSGNGCVRAAILSRKRAGAHHAPRMRRACARITAALNFGALTKPLSPAQYPREEVPETRTA